MSEVTRNLQSILPNMTIAPRDPKHGYVKAKQADAEPRTTGEVKELMLPIPPCHVETSRL